MAIRETLDRRKNVTLVISGLVIVVAAIIIFYESRPPSLQKIDKAFYSDDDGQTYFVDSIDKLFPFDHNGKQAYRAYVFKSSDGTIFVGYLARYTDSARAKLQQLMARPYNEVAQQIADTVSAGTEIKKPGDSTWYSQTSPRAAEILVPKPPNGGPVEGVMP
jgi:hypothetical protein